MQYTCNPNSSHQYRLHMHHHHNIALRTSCAYLCSVQTIKMRIVHCPALFPGGVGVEMLNHWQHHQKPSSPAQQCCDVPMHFQNPFISDVLSETMCYTEKVTQVWHLLERHYNACANRRNQCSPNKTKSYSNPTPPRKRQNNPINGHTPCHTKPSHTRLTYTRMRPHAPSHRAGDHPVPIHTERHNPSNVVVWCSR